MTDRRTSILLLAFIVVAPLLAGCASTPSSSAPQTRELQVFTSTLDFDEDAVGLPHDTFTPDTLVANKGDTVIIHVHNVEDADEHHTFTMNGTYAVDKDLGQGEQANVTLTVSTAGIFPYVCRFHQPTMTGYLVVLG